MLKDKRKCLSCKYAWEMATVGWGDKPQVACFYIGITGVSRYDDGVTCYCYERGHNDITESVKNRIRRECGEYID